jgi:cytochrome c-type biogenesis protein CcmH/NrfF
MEYFCGTCNSTFPDTMILDKTTIIEQTEAHVLYEGNTFCPRCQNKSVYCKSNALMVPKLRGTFVDRIQGYGDKHDVVSSRLSTEPRVTKLEKRPIE